VYPTGTVLAGQTCANYDIAPLYFEGTRIQRFATMYEKYRFKKLHFKFVTAKNSSTDGMVGMAYDHDVMDPTPQSGDAGIRLFTSMNEHKIDKAWVDITINAKCTDDPEFKFTNESASGDPRLVYQGQLYVFLPVPLSGVSAGASIGLIEVQYDCEFIEPQLETPETGYVGDIGASTSYNVLSNSGLSLQGTNSNNLWSAVQQSGTLNSSGTPPSTIPSPKWSTATQTTNQVPFLREGYYAYELLAKMVSTPVGAVLIGTPVISPKPGAVLGTNNNTLNAGVVTPLGSLSTAAAGTGQTCGNIGVAAVGPGGGYFDNLYPQSSSSSDTVLSLSNLVVNILPISLRLYQAYLKTAANPVAPLPFKFGPDKRKSLEVKSRVLDDYVGDIEDIKPQLRNQFDTSESEKLLIKAKQLRIE